MRSLFRLTLFVVLSVPAFSQSLISKPFFLKAEISEPDNAETDYKGTIEEQWLSKDKWRFSINTPEYKAVIIRSGEKYSAQASNDFLPHWVANLMRALNTPIPQTGHKALLDVPSSGQGCSRRELRVGPPEAKNSVFSEYCFGRNGELKSVIVPGYDAEFSEFKSFDGIQVPRKILMQPEPGVEIHTEIKELKELQNPDSLQFETLPAMGAVHMMTDEEAAAALRNAPPIEWPSVRDGRLEGEASFFVSADREGHIRETLPLNSHNPQMGDAVRKQLERWTLKPYVSNGTPLQFDAILTFHFKTQIGNAYPLLTNDEARKLASKIVEAKFPAGVPHGEKVTIRATFNKDAKLTGVDNPYHMDTGAFLAAYRAVGEWKFRAFMKDGKPEAFKADITFLVP